MEHFYQHLGENWFNYEELYRDMVDKHNSGSHFVEVGCWKGRSASYMAVEIINSGKDISFTCVDTFAGSIEHTDPESWCFCEPLSKDPEYLFNEFTRNIEPVKDYITVKRMTSLDAAQTFLDDSLDFVFIDASHEYADVVADLIAWYPKVKSGGYIAGHDYHDGSVYKAVQHVLGDQKIDQIVNCYIIKKP
jgi:cephalosporin hydroxylase